MDYSYCLIYYYCGPYTTKFFHSETTTPTTPEAALSAERMRTALSSSSGEPTLLQRDVSESGPQMVSLESAAAIPGDEVRESQADRSEPTLSRAYQNPQITRTGGR